MASFENASSAQSSFENLSNQRAPDRQVWFGSTILIRVPRDAPDLRTTLEAKLKAEGAATQIIHPRTAHGRFAAIATSVEKAAEFQKQIADFNPLPRFMSLLPPWSTVWRRAPQREAWTRNRNVLLELIKTDVVPDVEQSKALQQELMRAYRRRDRAVRIEKRLDVDGLVAKAQQRVEKLVDKIERIDRLPQSAKTKEIKFGRTHAVVQLGQSVALWEFAETLRLVPVENRALVRRYSKSLKPLLVATGTIDPLNELKEWEKEDYGVQHPVQHASGEKE